METETRIILDSEALIRRMKFIESSRKNKINSEVFELFKKQEFADFIDETFIKGGSDALRDKRVEESHKDAVSKLITNLKPNTNQSFLNIIGISGSGKSEVIKKLQKRNYKFKYFPLDEMLKKYLDDSLVQSFSLFQTDGKFDAKKFEYVMYCAAFISGKYSDYIIDHSGGSPLQPGMQALAEGLAGSENNAIHLSVKNEIVANNIANTVMYDSYESVKEPVRDAIGVRLDLVKKGYEKLDPSRKSLVDYEKGIERDKDNGVLLKQLRDKYREFCDRETRLATTTKRIEAFKEQLLKEKDLERKSLIKMLDIHCEESLRYVEENEWRREQFNNFNRRTKISQNVNEAAQMIANYMGRERRLGNITKKLKTIVAFMKANKILSKEEVLVCKNLTKIEGQTDVYLFDMHGVLHSGGEIPKKTLEYLKRLRTMGKTIVIASNDVRSGADYIEAIKRDKSLIAGKHFDYAITSGDVFGAMLESGEIEKQIREARQNARHKIGDNPIKLFIQDQYDVKKLSSLLPTKKFVITEDIDEADAVLTGSPRGTDGKRILIEDKETYLRERKAVMDKIITKKLPIIAPNPDTELPFDGPDFGLGYQTIGSGKMADICKKQGVCVIRTGKPSKNYYDYVKKILKEKGKGDILPEKIAMIGDSFGTDIIGANGAGFRTVAVVNDRSNAGLMVAKRGRSFIKQLSNERTTPSVFIRSVI